MIFERSITVVDSHTAGEPFRLVTGGIAPVKGKTMADKLEHFKNNFDHIRKGIMLEPRGHADMFGGILTEPVTAYSDFGILFIEGSGYLNMCGHGTIATVTIILETGLKKMEYPVSTVVLDTPAGVVKCLAQCENGKVVKVSFENVPSFLYKKDLLVTIDDKKYKVDVAFSGSFFALVNESEIGVDVTIENIPKLKELAYKIEHTLNEMYEFFHPTLAHIKRVDLVEIYSKNTDGNSNAKNIVIFGGSVDRSPCGTGTSAKIATLYAKGELQVGEIYKYSSIINSVFEGKIIGTTKVGEFDAIIPEISGCSYITGFNTILWDKNDPYFDGFKL